MSDKYYVSKFNLAGDDIWVKDKKTEDCVNVVLDYGADNKGVADSTEAIQNALNSGKPYIYFPDGHYKISDMLKVNSNSYLFAKNALIDQMSTTALGVLINNSDGNTGGWEANENIILDGLSFNIHTKWGCVVFGHCTNITIVNCRFENDSSERMQGHHIEINSCLNTIIENCYFTSKLNLNECVQLDVANSQSAFPWFGPYDNTYNKDVKIDKCSFIRDSLPNATVLDDYLDSAIGNHNGADDARITGVHVTNCYISGYKTGIAFRYIVDSIISGNIIEKCQVGITSRGDGINYRDVLIADNVLVGNKADFKSQISDTKYCRGINIQNPNSVNNTVTIKNNIVRAFAGTGILVCGSNFLISGNYVRSNGLHGIYAGRTSFKTTYTNNICQSNSSLADTPDNFYDLYVVQSNANPGKNAGANYVFGNCVEKLGMNILETGLSRNFVFDNKYQYILQPANNNIDTFGNTVTGTGEYNYTLVKGNDIGADDTGKWVLLAETPVAEHDSIWIIHGEATIPANNACNATLRLMLGSQEIARQSLANDGTVQRSIAVTSMGFIAKGSSGKLYMYSDKAITMGNIRFRNLTVPSQTAAPTNF